VGRIDAIAVGDYYELGAHVSATNVGTDGSIYFAVHDGSDALWGVEITQKSATSNTFVNQVSLITGDGGTPTKTTIDVGDNNDRYSLEEPSTVTVGLHIVEVDTVAVYVNRRYFGSISSPGSVNTGSRYIIFAPNNNIQDGGGTGRATMYDFAKVEGLVTPDTPQTVNNPNLVIFGEDGTYGLENNTPWTTQLQKAAGKLTGLGDNLNISQDFSGPDEDVASQLTIAISSLAAVSPAPDVAIISLGHNDALLSTNRGTFRSDLEALIAQVNGDFPDAVVVLVLPWFTPNDTIQASLSDYALVTQTVAAENNAIIADAMTTASAFTFGDLNEAFPQGSAAIASAVAAGVYKALADQTLGPSPIKAPELLNSTYGHGSRTVMQGPARPTQGLFTAGDYFALTTPFSAGVNPDDYFVVGYFRVTTGSGNVLDTDWYSDRVYRLPRTN
jgi:lysophospholipase L1-like esterase